MMPFDTYPCGGAELLGKCGDDSCRRGYGLKLQRLTGQTVCAYCGLCLVDTYEHWLLLSVDHVIPSRTGLARGLNKVWLQDFANTVLCCSACNGFGNRYEIAPLETPMADFAGFIALRDATFAARKVRILESQRNEREFFERRPWTACG